MKKFFCFLICVFVLTSCAAGENNESVSFEENIVTEESETTSLSMSENITPEDQDIQTENEASEYDTVIEEELFFSIDLNYDGITEDFYLDTSSSYDGFCIVMYDDTEKKHITDKITIYRTDKIDIYKRSDDIGTEHYYSVFLNSAYKRLLLNCLYTGNNDNRGFAGRSYGEDMKSPIFCFVFNSTIYKESFDELLADTKKFLKKYDDLEYVTTVDLTSFFNEGYSEEYIGGINICDGMKEISVYGLKNDIFGKSIKFTNGTYSYYANECSNIEVYNRPRRVWEYDSVGEAYVSETPDDYDYLLCLKSTDGQNAELIYLGNTSESRLVSYYCYYDISYAATRSEIDIDIEDFNAIMENSVSFMKNEGWEYMYTIDSSTEIK